ncbi:UDP-glycosyltransferase 88B1-like [Coffea arabica]|uniref:Glycosyltransferase n=1 Tax=Coffea arabica TaxID=13443 RepID=A0A6P6VLT5_COFAR|nr:UDP-glycosyltransferase 88B1-like [Coffea arabica]
MASNRTIVLYPSPGMGHLVSMVELGKFTLNHHPGLAVTILVVNPPYNTAASTAAYMNRISATTPSITFHHLPSPPLDPDSYPSIEALHFELLRLSNPHVHQALHSISLTAGISAFIIDFFCTCALSVATNLGIPTYYFFTSGANCLALLLYLRTLHQSTNKSYKDLGELLHVPDLPPIPPRDMPVPLLERTSPEYAFFLDAATQLANSSGILVNTFESLEPNILKSIADGKYVPDGPTPPVFSLGPLIASDNGKGGGAAGETGGGVHECLKWLDMQPSQSVVFLCFGSLGRFPAEQLKEIAIGLERSEQKFLWVVRSPPSEDKTSRFQTPPAPGLDLLLPHGFLDRTKDRGFMVSSWAPQVDVLNHGSVGGFVTHCGWNSVLEAVRAGVPMVGWPLYAEQKLNKLFLVEEMKLALPMDESTEGGFVKAAEIEKRVRGLMDSEEAKVIRQRAQAKKEEAKQAMADGGSSTVALAKLVESWRKLE